MINNIYTAPHECGRFESGARTTWMVRVIIPGVQDDTYLGKNNKFLKFNSRDEAIQYGKLWEKRNTNHGKAKMG